MAHHRTDAERGTPQMSKSALADAYAAGFKDGRESVGKVRDNDAGEHCILGFDGWWQRAVDTADRSPTPANAADLERLEREHR